MTPEHPPDISDTGPREQKARAPRLSFVDPEGRVRIGDADGNVRMVPLPGRPRGLPALDGLARPNWPCWSPDGQKIAAVSHGTADGGAFLFDIRRPRLSRWIPLDDPPIYVCWLPEKGRLGAVLPSPEGLRLEVIDTSKKGAPRHRLAQGMPLFLHAQPKGDHLAIHLGAKDRSALHRVLLVGPNESSTCISNVGGRLRTPTWSPDGQLLAYGVASEKDPEITELHIADLRGERVRPPVPFKGRGAVSWAPDGSSVALAAGSVGQLPLLAQAAAVPTWGGAPALIHDGPTCCMAWIDSERLVAILPHEGEIRWCLLRREKGKPEPLSPALHPSTEGIFYAQFYDQFACSHPLISADRRRLAYTSGSEPSLVNILEIDSPSNPMCLGPGTLPSWEMDT